MKNEIINVLRKTKKGISIDKIMNKINCNDHDLVKKILDELIEDRSLYISSSNNYNLISNTSFRYGILSFNSKGDGVVNSFYKYYLSDKEFTNKSEKYIIDKSSINGAKNGDLVLIDTSIKPRVIDVFSNDITNVIGYVEHIGEVVTVKSFNKNHDDITILVDGAYVDGDVVSVNILEKMNNSFYKGEVIKKLKHKDDPKDDILIEAIKSGMEYGFSNDTIKSLDAIPHKVSENDLIGRVDLCDLEVISIDGIDTKDRDDAISLEKLDNGNYLLGIHIADVSHFVKKDSFIDLDAYRKGNSYYFGGAVNPMIPHEISNGICSLNEKVKRLCKTLLLEIDKNGNVIDRKLFNSVIKSSCMMNYDDVNKLLEGYDVYNILKYKEKLQLMNKLAHILRKKRFYNGALSFNRSEIKFKYDDYGNVVDVGMRENKDAEKLIEEFMLIANNNIADMISKNNIPYIYRTHEGINQERLDEFLNMLYSIGLPFYNISDNIINDKKLMQKLIKHISNTNVENMLNNNLIRCMMRAKYNYQNYEHYATGFNTYSHFTSPIRRYADLTCHNIIDECFLEKEKSKRENNSNKWKSITPIIAYRTTMCEKISDEVEKNVNLMKMAEYMEKFIGKEFNGTIDSISSNGINILLDNYIEGRVKYSNLDGKFIYNSDYYTAINTKDNLSYSIGDRVVVKVLGSDKINKNIDFTIINKIKEKDKCKVKKQ